MAAIWAPKVYRHDYSTATDYMVRNDYTAMGGSKRSFPSTHWSLVDAVRGSERKERRAALEQLIALYWKPTYCWLRRYGYDDATAKDLVQEFFLWGMQKGKFEKADPARGRFRTFLLTCVKNFVVNFERDKKAKGRLPNKTILSIEKLKTDDIAVELVDKGTPEDSFNRAWVKELLVRVLKCLEEECLQTGKECHFEIFRQRIIEPILAGSPQPPIKELAEKMGLTEKQVCNHAITARRAYQRLLREEIRMYASSDDEVAAEIRDLFKLVVGP